MEFFQATGIIVLYRRKLITLFVSISILAASTGPPDWLSHLFYANIQFHINDRIIDLLLCVKFVFVSRLRV